MAKVRLVIKVIYEIGQGNWYCFLPTLLLALLNWKINFILEKIRAKLKQPKW